MKTRVITKTKDTYGDFEAGDIGYIDGYLTADSPKAVVVLPTKNKIVLCSLYNLEVIPRDTFNALIGGAR